MDPAIYAVLSNQQKLIRLMRQRRKVQIQLYEMYFLLIAAHTKQWTLPKSDTWWNNIAKEMPENMWRCNFRISKKTYVFLCEKLNTMERQNTNLRKCIPLGKRIAIAIYKLSSSAEYRTIANLFGVGKSSVCEIVNEFCYFVVEKLLQEFIQFPTSEESAKNCILGFRETWGFPQCIGAIDGCHIKIKPKKEHATSYFNYKQFYSIILLAVCDYAYRFLYINVGSPGRNNDAFVFKNSSLYEYVKNNALWKHLGMDMNSINVPACLIGDSAFPLMETLQKPYPFHANLTETETRYNYMLSRSRRVVENVFGRLKARFRILQVLDLHPEHVKQAVQTCCVLNNICELFGDEIDPKWLGTTIDYNEPSSTHSSSGENDASARAIRDAVAAYLM